MLLWFCLLLGHLLVSGEKLNFDGYKLYRIVPANRQQLLALKELREHSTGVYFWKGISGVNKPVEVIVPPQKLTHFSGMLQKSGLSSAFMAEDLQRLLDLESPSYQTRKFGLTKYNTLEEIYAWLESLAEEHPNVVTTVIGGQTYEGRQIKGVKVSYSSGNPGVFLEAGIHAEEWIGPAAAICILDQLLKSADPNIRNIAENFDWYIFPSINPDGYVYSHTTNRTWRKTRSPTSDTCYGVDANRNWDFHWMDGGSSEDPCSAVYAGPRAFSEMETKTLSEFIANISSSINVYLSFHAFGQVLMFPYGYSQEHTPTHDTLMGIGKKAAESLASRNGTYFEVGTIANVFYIASGNSLDWAYGVGGVPITYVYELGDRMILPPDMIVPTSEEVLDSIVTILRESHVVRKNSKYL